MEDLQPPPSISPHCSFVLLAEFDIDKGSTLSHVYPSKSLVESHDDHTLAELMLPDGAHARSEDWTVFFLKQSHQDQVTYVLNLVRTKHDDSVRRGALVKAMALGTSHPCIHVFKPILLLALDEYFTAPGPSSLARLYDSINAIDLTSLPVLTRSEKLVLKASDRKDLFLDKYITQPDIGRPPSAAAVSAQGSLSRPISPVATRRRPSEVSQHSTMPRDTHFWETSIQYAKMDIPIKWPMDAFDEEVGEYSLSTLFSTFSTHPVAGPLHAHLHSNGNQTPPMTILFNAILTGKRVIFLGHNMPAATVAGHVLAAAALATGCGAVIPNLVRTRCSPYANLISLDTLEETPGFIAGVTNPRFEELKCWDLLCNIETGKMTIAKEIEPAPRLNLTISSGSMSYTTGIGSSNGSMGISNDIGDLSSTSIDNGSVHRTIGRGGAGSIASVSTSPNSRNTSTIGSLASVTSYGNASGMSSPISGDEFGNRIPSSNTLPHSGIPDARPDSFDLVFMEEMLSAIGSRYSEQYIRSRVIDYVTSFARHVHRHEDYFYQRGTVTQQPYLNGQLGSGTAFGDREGETKELISNAGRVEGFKLTSSYNDWLAIDSERRTTQNQIFHPDSTTHVDIWHQLSRLRGRGKTLSSAELELILIELEKSLRTEDQIIELLTLLPQYTSGLSVLAQCLYHPNTTIRITVCELLNRIGSYPYSGLKFIQQLPLFHRLSMARIQSEWEQDMRGIPQQQDTGGKSTIRAGTPSRLGTASSGRTFLSAPQNAGGKLGLPPAMSRQVSSASSVASAVAIEDGIGSADVDGLPGGGENAGGSTFRALSNATGVE